MNRKRFLVFPILLALCILSLSGCDILTPKEPEVTTEYIDEEEYIVFPAFPPQNKIFEKSDPPPEFAWQKYKGYPDYLIIEIDYIHDGTYMSLEPTTGYISMTESEWLTVLEDTPIEDDVQKIYWRIRIDYKNDPTREPYYTAWQYFGIKVD